MSSSQATSSNLLNTIFSYYFNITFHKLYETQYWKTLLAIGFPYQHCNSVGCLLQATLRFARGFFYHRRRKTTNLIHNEIHVTGFYFKTFCDSVILARTVIPKHSVIVARNILRFWQRERNKQKARKC